MPCERLQQPARVQFPDACSLIGTASHHALAIRAESDGEHKVRVTGERVQFGPAGGIPQACRVVFRSGQNPPTVRTPSHGHDGTRVTAQASWSAPVLWRYL